MSTYGTVLTQKHQPITLRLFYISMLSRFYPISTRCWAVSRTISIQTMLIHGNSNYQHTKNADPWEGGRRLADLSHRGEVSEAAKELHRAECNVLATIFWEWVIKFLTYIYQRDSRVLMGSIEVLMPGYQKKSGSWYLRHISEIFIYQTQFRSIG